MKRESLHCTICGADITRAMKIYPHGRNGGAYCYDCAEQDRLARAQAVVRKVDTLEMTTKRIVWLYRHGHKVSDIAEALDMSAKEVYELLTEAISE